MNELIEELWDTHCRFVDGKHTIGYEYFIQAIQTACKAQRNACKRIYLDMEYHGCDMDKPHGYSEDLATAEIERCDYE